MVTDRNEARSGPTLRRALGRTTATFLTAAMFIGTGLFAALGATTEQAGSGLLLAIVFSGLVALATGLSAASVGINFPEEGGGFSWSRKFGYPTLGFVAGCAYLGKGIVSTVVISLAFAMYTAQMVKGLSPFAMHIVASAAVLLVAAINFLGVELNAKVLVILLFVQLALLGVFVGFAAPAVRVANLTPLSGNGMFGVLAGAAIFFWSWDGFMRMAIMASEVKEPRRTIPFAVVGGIAFAAVVFLAVASTTLGVLGPESMGRDDVPLFRAATQALGTWGGLVILAAAWTASLSELVGDLLTASRVAYTMGEANELPGWLGSIHPKFRIPRNAVLTIGFIVLVLALSFDLRRLLAIASIFTLTWYIITHFSALQLRKEQRLTTPLFSWLGLLGCLLLVASLPIWATLTGSAVLATLAGFRLLWFRYRTPKVC